MSLLVWSGLAAIVSLAGTVGLRLWLTRRGIALAQPRPRDVHTKPIPRLGGLAVVASFLVVVILISIFDPSKLHFTNQTIFGVDRSLLGIIGGIIVLAVAGAVDDIRGMSPSKKFFWQLVAASIVAASYIAITVVTDPFGGTLAIGNWGYVLVVLWILVVINAVNFLDGLDGLASGMSLIATVTLYLLAVQPDVNQVSMSVLAAILIGSLIGFLPLNWFPAKIFLGDSGSMVLGFLLAVFAIISGGKFLTAVLVLGIPLFDLAWVVMRRLHDHQPIYQADRLHLHHRLLQVGLSQRRAVTLIYFIVAAFGIIALRAPEIGKLTTFCIIVGLMFIGAVALVVVGRQKENNGKKSIAN